MPFDPTNATGWTQLVAGNPIAASFFLYNTVFAGYFLIMLVTMFNIVLWVKSGKPMIPFIINSLLLAFFGFTQALPGYQLGIIVLLEIGYLAGILYKWFYMDS